MLQMYSDPVSLYCAKLRILMRHKGIAFEELPPPGGYGSAEYRRIVPSGTLPAILHEGMQLADSEAIAEYLNEAFPDVPMMPEDLQLRAKAREKSRFHDTKLEPAVRAFFPQVAYEGRDPDKVKELGDALSTIMVALELLLEHSPLDPDALYIADCGFAVTLGWIREFEKGCGLQVTWPEGVLAYEARLMAHPAVADEFAAYRAPMDGYMTKAYPA
ncbi:glutathione S-transferase family protein [Phaeobacter sp. CNT1-3]|nr:glutathione S-transferase family protein [Phaeobacter sp. CNT1-3]